MTFFFAIPGLIMRNAKAALLLAGTALMGILYLLGRRSGAAEERQEAIEKDRTHADEIRDRVDAVRTADSLHRVDSRIFRD